MDDLRPTLTDSQTYDSLIDLRKHQSWPQRFTYRFLYPIKWKCWGVQRWWWRKTDPVSYDAIDLCSALPIWLLPRLRWLRDNAHGYPVEVIYDDHGRALEDEMGAPVNSMTFDKWIDIIEEMIEGFELAAEDDDYSLEANAKQGRAAQLLGRWLPALWT